VYLGLAAGASVPRGGLARRVHEESGGYNVSASAGWDPVGSPLGLRFDATFNRLAGRDLGNTIGAYDNTNVFSALLDAKLRVPFGRFNNSTSGLYLVGGGGIHHIRNFQKIATLARATTNDQGIDLTENTTRPGVNGGAGFALGLGAAELFVEGRYVRVYTPGRKTDYAPLVIGVNFF
jgi:hypothetical protein